MKKTLLLLAAGAVALPGLAIADAHGYSQSISGQVRVQHTQSSSSGLDTSSNSLGDDDSHINWNHHYTGDKGSVSGFIRFQPSGEWRYGASGSSTDGDWTATGKAEWDFDMTNTSNTDAESTAYRDVYIKLANASGLYLQLGNMQYGDQMKGYSNNTGGGLSRGSSAQADNVLSNGDYDGSAYFVTNEARFAALQAGYNLGNGIDVNLVLQMDTDASLFGAYSNDAATNTVVEDDASTTDVDETETETTTQSTTGTLLQFKYAANNVDAVVNLYSGSVEDADTDVTGNSADGKAEASATQIGVSYSAGMFTPFVNLLTAKVDQTPDAGDAVSYDASVTNLGLAVSLANGDAVNLSATSTSASSDVDGSADESGSAMEVQYSTNIAGVAINAGYGSGEYDDDLTTTEDDDDSYLSVRLQYAF